MEVGSTQERFPRGGGEELQLGTKERSPRRRWPQARTVARVLHLDTRSSPIRLHSTELAGNQCERMRRNRRHTCAETSSCRRRGLHDPGFGVGGKPRRYFRFRQGKEVSVSRVKRPWLRGRAGTGFIPLQPWDEGSLNGSHPPRRR
ncbi:hypothetical protein NN561_014707 [Cricetulus griseus]